MKTNLTLKCVGAFEPDHEELQNYAPEMWGEDSLIFVYDTNNTHPEYDFVFIEKLGESAFHAGEFHVCVGNVSEVYANLQDAEIVLKKLLS